MCQSAPTDRLIMFHAVVVWRLRQVRCLFTGLPLECSTCMGVKQWRRMNGRIISICLNYTLTACNFHCASYIYKLVDNSLVLRVTTPLLTAPCSRTAAQPVHWAKYWTSYSELENEPAPRNAQFCILCILLLIWSMLRCSDLPQGGCTMVVQFTAVNCFTVIHIKCSGLS